MTQEEFYRMIADLAAPSVDVEALACELWAKCDEAYRDLTVDQAKAIMREFIQ
jgi:hypothetical protein